MRLEKHNVHRVRLDKVVYTLFLQRLVSLKNIQNRDSDWIPKLTVCPYKTEPVQSSFKSLSDPEFFDLSPHPTDLKYYLQS